MIFTCDIQLPENKDKSLQNTLKSPVPKGVTEVMQ